MTTPHGDVEPTGHPNLDRHLGRNPSLPLPLLAALSQNPNTWARQAVADNPAPRVARRARSELERRR